MWTFLVLLAWSQVAIAAHQFEHSATELDDTCVTCLQNERNDDVLVSADADTPQTADRQIRIASETSSLVCAYGFTHYRSRASP